MSVINATLAAGTRRMLHDVLAYNHARGQDINRLNAMVASGLIPKDEKGVPQIPKEVLDGLYRPFPGSNSTVTVTNIGNGQSSDPSSGQQPAAPAAPGQPSPEASSPAPQGPTPATVPSTAGNASPSGGILTTIGNLSPWIKTAAMLAGAGTIGAWIANLNSPTVSPIAPTKGGPSAAEELMYELHLGSPQKPASGAPNG